MGCRAREGVRGSAREGDPSLRFPRLLIAVALLLVLAGGGWWYVKPPDLPPGGLLALLPDPGRVASRLPIIGSGGGKTTEPLVGEQGVLDSTIAALDSTPAAKAEAQIRQALASTGLPITAVDFTTTSEGKTALVVGLDASKLLKGGSFDPGLTGGVEGIIALVKAKSLDLSATEHVVVAVADGQSRPLFGIAAPASAIAAFRDGKISQQDFLKSVAIKAESRAALLDAARSLAAR